MDTILSFYGKSSNIHIFEIKSLFVPNDCSKDKKYQWFIIDDGVIKKFEFEKAYEENNKQYRIFKGFILSFNESAAIFYDKTKMKIFELQKMI